MNAPEGITPLDYFAAAALQGLVASNSYDRIKLTGYQGRIVPMIVQLAYEYGKEMLEARKLDSKE